MKRAFLLPATVIALATTACVAYVPAPVAGYPNAPPYAAYQGQPAPPYQAPPPVVVAPAPAPAYYYPPYAYGPAYYGPGYIGPSVGFYVGGGGHHGWRR